MHNACPNVDCRATLVVVNTCSMMDCFCPSMAVVAVENPCKNATLKTWFSHCLLILKRILVPVSLWQHQLPGRHLAFLSAHDNLCFVAVRFVLRSVAVCWSIWSKLVRNTISFQNVSVVLFDFQPWSDPL